MRRDYLKLRLSDPSPGSVSSSFHASDSDDESSERVRREETALPLAVTAKQVRLDNAAQSKPYTARGLN